EPTTTTRPTPIRRTSRSRWRRSRRSATARTRTSRRPGTDGPARRSGTVPSPWATGRSRASRSATTTSSTPPLRMRWHGRCAARAVLVATPDTAPDDPAAWQVATTREPTDDERRDLDLAWRLVRGVTSNAIVLVRDGRLIGLGSGQTSRVDAARQAVEKARTI